MLTHAIADCKTQYWLELPLDIDYARVYIHINTEADRTTRTEQDMTTQTTTDAATGGCAGVSEYDDRYDPDQAADEERELAEWEMMEPNTDDYGMSGLVGTNPGYRLPPGYSHDLDEEPF
jgi:hypothetical protein